MELVYLWIDKYKNIEKQGFCFSPKYKCSYDPDKNELNIEENKNYKSIFPDNINITAIVGKNGSGKSSISKIIFLFSKFSITDDISKIILVVKNNQGLYYRSNFDIKTNINKLEENKYIGFEIYSYFADHINVHNIGNYFFIGNEENVIKLDQKNIIKIMINLKFDKNFKLSSFMYIPSVLNIVNKKDKIDKVFEQIMLKNNTKYKQKAKDIFNMINDTYHKFLAISFIENHFEKKTIRLGSNLEGLHIDNFNNDELNCLKDIKCLEKKLSDEPIHSRDVFNKIFSNDQVKIINALSKKEKEIYAKYYNYFYYFDLIDSKDRHYNDLSYGEKVIFGQLIWIYHVLSRKNEDILFVFDEPDISLHPEWQRKYLYEIYNLCSKFASESHFIITTHSPFILSDIPKENIIFLKDGKNVSDEVEIDTFGANIHTLLSNAFFMEDGLIGDFAKAKIDEVIKFLNNEESEIESIVKARNIINIIGEPIIKNQLQKMLKNVQEENINSDVDFLKQKVKELEEKIKELENEKNTNNY